ncbi:uncharacterized protein LOC110860443 isoform X2 [Folsomia candida]|uniref:uncharacterized protein LOC110860443 isoform X2 n=1 Tax=Folsomia candida TaxID=158441 RepID=UPI001604E9C0|nr:uncharacterized protein LOC110860443 isoform X2 [Folsomia candida]
MGYRVILISRILGTAKYNKCIFFIINMDIIFVTMAGILIAVAGLALIYATVRIEIYLELDSGVRKEAKSINKGAAGLLCLLDAILFFVTACVVSCQRQDKPAPQTVFVTQQQYVPPNMAQFQAPPPNPKPHQNPTPTKYPVQPQEIQYSSQNPYQPPAQYQPSNVRFQTRQPSNTGSNLENEYHPQANIPFNHGNQAAPSNYAETATNDYYVPPQDYE